MATKNAKNEKRMRLKRKIRAKVFGTDARPRLAVYRSNTHIYAQAINDTTGKTLAAASDVKMKSGTKAERAKQVGALIAESLIGKKISNVVFDRGGFKYTGRIKMLADEARKSGLNF